MTMTARHRATHRTWLLALVGVIALVAAACGNGTDTTDGTTTTAGDTGTTEATGDGPTDEEIAALTVKISGGGASFPDAFYQAVNADFNELAGRELVTYAKSGSSDGRKQLAEQTVDFAGSDSLPKPDETFAGGNVLFFPTTAAPITVSFNVAGVDELRLTPDTLARIMSAQITNWNDAAIAADNPGVTFPSQRITVVHRSDGSGTTNNFTKYLAAAAPEAWTLGSGDTVNWPAGTQGAEKNSGVATVIGQTAGAIGYVDLADAVKADLTPALLRNAAGKFVGPTEAASRAALEGAEVNDDLTYNPLNAEGEGAYPITAPTWILVYENQTDPAKAQTLRTFLRYLLTTGQSQASKNAFAALPEGLDQRALAQIDRITG
jgi:phosphate transport system substrate-binding protein